jgi:8-oxo-dGTP pyrophosphatase MutT (NUDIX family)
MTEQRNPWQTLSKKIAYENNWIEVVHKEMLNPNGNPAIYGQVNFKNVAIGVIPIDDEGFTWLVGQYRVPLDAYSWEIPEGGCSIDEEWVEAAKRELKEETGLLASEYENICKIHTSNSVCNEVGYIFLAKGISQSESEPEDTEDLKIKKIHISEALEMVMKNEITDSLSVAGILKVARLVGI